MKQIRKLMAAAAVMLVAHAAAAWSQTTLYQRGGSGTAWSNADLTEWVGDKSDYGTVMVNGTATPRLTRTANASGLAFESIGGKTSNGFADNTTPVACNFTKTLTGSEEPKANTLLTYNFVWNPGNATGTADHTNTYLTFGDIRFSFYGQSWYMNVKIGSETTKQSAVSTRNANYTFSVTVNQMTKGVSYTIASGGAVIAQGNGTTEATEFNTIQYGLSNDRLPYWSLGSNLVNISVTEEEATATANYTVNFVDEDGVTLKPSVIRSGSIGEAPTIYSSEKNPFFGLGDIKYFYKSDDSEGKTIVANGSTVVTIVYRKAQVYTYLARGVYGDEDLVFADGVVQEGESVTVRPPKYILLPGTNKLLTQNEGLAIKITPDADGYAKEVAYKLSKENVVFFSEAENINYLTPTIDNVYCKDRLSGGAGAYANGQSIPFASIPCGKYRITVGAMGGTSLQFKAGTAVVCTASGSGNTNVETVSNEFTLDERTILYMEPGGNAGTTSRVANAADYIIVEQIEKGSCTDEGEEPLPEPESTDLRLVDEHVFKDITVLKAARDTYARPNPSGKTRRNGKPVVFYIGDSTTRNGSAGNGNIQAQWGWGFYAQEFIDSTKAVCENHALGGTSARSFYRDQWPAVKAGIKPGDFVVIGFGHNDGGSNWDTRSSISGTSATDTRTVVNSAGNTEIVYSFGQYLRMFANDVKALGATPVLVSMTARYSFNNGTAALNTQHRLWTKTVAEEMGLSFLDIGLKAQQYYTKYGEWKAYQFFCNDNSLHTGLRGAWENAWYHAQCIYEDENNPMRKLVNDPTPATLDINRQAGKPYTFIVGNSDKTSARDCYRSGDWSLVYNTIAEGDTVKMAFGKTELESTVKDGELGCIASASDALQNISSSVTGRYELTGSYGWYIHWFANDTKEKGGVPVLVTTPSTPSQVVAWNEAVAQRLGIKLEVRDDELPTGISQPSMATAPGSGQQTIYTLDGRRTEKMTKGIYIHNGKKVIVK